jgi:uncharacterized protein
MQLLAGYLFSHFGIQYTRKAGFQDGVDAYDWGDYASALEEWRPIAVPGNFQAQFNVGQKSSLVQSD